MTDITYLQVVNEIRRVAAEQPDFVYEAIEHEHPRPTCVYVEQVAPNSYKSRVRKSASSTGASPPAANKASTACTPRTPMTLRQ